MKQSGSVPSAEPFFLKAGIGERFCLYHPPRSNKECRGLFIYVHPFGDEMNKARRMAAIQARAFAALGFAVLQMDLFGCGDSSGEFRDARWDIWKQDLFFARSWMEKRIAGPVNLWGLRLGALLALDFAKSSENRVHKIILWQPVINGEAFLTQFLRLRLASEVLGSNTAAEKATGTSAMRALLRTGNTLEVAGYELAPELATAIGGLKAAELMLARCNIHWFEIMAEPGRPLAPASARLAAEWQRNGVDLHVHLVSGLPFWATQEIAECPELVEETVSVAAVRA
jgi:exosortase A-associated hydrolase 2